ncbi:hypothetical protein Clacol_008338 [Clathrus columnatus]|uniref:Cytochrome P450 n=1 Tax=Clathrus columnatus TaxID=1419009 RepID=A0AAV5AMD9_9AGAM|nr:hypothetical protein Clacol_008338 [Clathrus columnatus]
MLISPFVRAWGHSVASANGELWRRHKRAVNPAFHGPMHVHIIFLVYDTVRFETAQVYQELLEHEGWGTQNSVFVPSIKEVLKTTFLVILGRCGFGLPMEWPKKERVDLSAEMPLTQAIEISAATYIAKIMLPEWAYKLPMESVQAVKKAWDTMFHKTDQIIRDRRSATIKDAADEGGYILRSLIESAIDESGNYLLDEKETAANMFTMFFAGHGECIQGQPGSSDITHPNPKIETTSSVITATLGFLALYEEEQEKAYQEILAFISEHGKIDIKDVETMPHLSACIFEAGRRYPAAFFLPRALTEDTGQSQTPCRTDHCSAQGLNNPRDFPEPHVFRPSRWYGVSDSDVLTFSTGPRACIGRKFALTESLNLLAHFLHEWKLDVVLNPAETREAYERRVMDDAGPDVTAFSVGKIPLKLTRRVALG